ncbi:MAG: glutamyl-tRNA reductase [Planctomycetaceae bacterium]|nr:glutamyl-tRNA reductase [Planctomycetaceae bacterium]
MFLRLIGLNHRTAPLDVRETLAFSPAQVSVALNGFEQHPENAEREAVLLSTCNRTEFYVASETAELPPPEQLLKFLLEQKSLNPLSTIDYQLSTIFTFDDTDAVEHLFSVAAGLDSMVLGDTQIASQIQTAYELAAKAEMVGSITNLLFQTAAATAREVAANTELYRHRVSIPSIAVVDFAQQIFERFDDKQIFVFGAGEMGRETLQYLTERGAKNITVLNRHRQRAERLAAEFNGHAADWEQRLERMVTADIIVSATGADEPVITLNDYKKIEPRRKGKTLFVLDLAVPRDFEPDIAACSGVYLYTLDDLQDMCSRNREKRDKEIPKAKNIVAKNVKQFIRDNNHRQGSEVIQQLRQRLTKIKENELNRLFNKLPDVNGRERGEIQYAFDRLVNKFLHPPLESLRDESKNGVPRKLLDALARLFQLGK